MGDIEIQGRGLYGWRMKTSAVRAGGAMLIDDGPKGEMKIQRGWRLKKSLVEYIEERSAKAAHGAGTALVEDALTLHKVLHERLGREGLRLQRYAADQQLDMGRDSAEVVARLVLAGLESHERGRKR